MRTLRKIRLDRGLTQAELGDEVGLSQMAISCYEIGTRKGTVDKWDRLEAVLGVDQRILRQPDPDGGR